MAISKEAVAVYNKQYYQKNKEKIAEKNKEKSAEQKAVYMKQYREKNKEKVAEQRKKNREKNKEKINDINKKWYGENKEKVAEYMKEYRQTERGKKCRRVGKWKYVGVVSNDFDALYEYYLECKNCENCNVELTEDKITTPTTRVLDHSHETGLFRNVLCNACNLERR